MIVVSYDAWRRLFNEDSLIVGRVLVSPFERSRVRIVGVAPVGFDYPAGVGHLGAAAARALDSELRG